MFRTSAYIDRLIDSDRILKEYMKSIKDYSNGVYEHCIKTAELSHGFAQLLNYDSKKVAEVVTGALVHDIGKTKLDKEILKKVEPLTPEEWIEVKKHTNYGIKIIGKEFGQIAYDIALLHHETLIGDGYPTQTTEIPEYVQFVSVADKYEAMSSKRTYKAAYNHADILAHLYQDCAKGKINMKYVDMLAQGYHLGVSGWNAMTEFFQKNQKENFIGVEEDLFGEIPFYEVGA